jgi:hypothetical protein
MCGQVRRDGGLYVIGTYIFESDRVELQLFGRAGRQVPLGGCKILTYCIYYHCCLPAVGLPAQPAAAAQYCSSALTRSTPRMV